MGYINTASLLSLLLDWGPFVSFVLISIWIKAGGTINSTFYWKPAAICQALFKHWGYRREQQGQESSVPAAQLGEPDCKPQSRRSDRSDGLHVWRIVKQGRGWGARGGVLNRGLGQPQGLGDGFSRDLKEGRSKPFSGKVCCVCLRKHKGAMWWELGGEAASGLWSLESHCQDFEVENRWVLNKEVHNLKLHIKRITLAAGLSRTEGGKKVETQRPVRKQEVTAPLSRVAVRCSAELGERVSCQASED